MRPLPFRMFLASTIEFSIIVWLHTQRTRMPPCAPSGGIEPTSSGLEPDALPLSYKGFSVRPPVNWGGCGVVSFAVKYPLPSHLAV